MPQTAESVLDRLRDDAKLTSELAHVLHLPPEPARFEVGRADGCVGDARAALAGSRISTDIPHLGHSFPLGMPCCIPGLILRDSRTRT